MQTLSWNCLASLAFHGAVEGNFVDLGKILISHGANVDHKDFNGQSLLHKAIEKGSCEFVQILVDRGASLSNGDRNKLIESVLAENIRKRFKVAVTI